MTPQELRDMVDRCLTHVRCAQDPLRVERADREPGAHRREVSAALLDLSDAEDRLVRAAPGGDGWALLLAEVPSLCARAREWIARANILEGKSIRTNLDAVIELLRLYGSADPVADATPVTTTSMSPPARRLSKHEQLDLLRLLDAPQHIRSLQGRPITDYLRDHFAAEDAEVAQVGGAGREVVAEIVTALRRHGWIHERVERAIRGDFTENPITHPNASMTDLCTDIAHALDERYGKQITLSSELATEGSDA